MQRHLAAVLPAFSRHALAAGAAPAQVRDQQAQLAAQALWDNGDWYCEQIRSSESPDAADHGQHYFHSGNCDLVATGLGELKPRINMVRFASTEISRLRPVPEHATGHSSGLFKSEIWKE